MEASTRQLSPELSSQQPAQTTILITGIQDPPQVWIVLPASGQLWVGYEYAGTQPATEVALWQQGGDMTPIPPGFNTYPVTEGDALMYQLASADQSIKLGWGYED